MVYYYKKKKKKKKKVGGDVQQQQEPHFMLEDSCQGKFIFMVVKVFDSIVS